jgi:beta-lactamase superfamily II metal-dependent hydrolase
MSKHSISAHGADSRHVSVRMYNVGFGDAFLVTVPADDGVKRILFDCGTIAPAPGRNLSEVVSRIVKDATSTDGVPHIDVVVATHRHRDHVSGFEEGIWANVEVSEVWLPWTEDPTDPQAREIRETQSRLALALSAAFQAKAAAGNPVEAAFAEMVSNALTNEKAMRTLHSGFKGRARRRFLPAEDPAERSFESKALPGVTIHALGPSRNKDVIRDMLPPKGETYLRLNAAALDETGKPRAPFAEQFIEHGEPSGASFPEEDRQKIRSSTQFSDLEAVVALDQAVNGTSLMLVLEVAGTHLLFAGDAQWGTWTTAMKDPRWTDILKQTRFYKIGHHGSENATPRSFVESLLPDGAWAMASTIQRDQWAGIPKPELLAALEKEKHVRLARSDMDENAPSGDAGFTVETGVVVEARIPMD